MATGHALEGGVRVCGHVTGRASRCLTTVRGRACVDTWAGASAGDCFKTVVPVTVCDFGLRWVERVSIRETRLTLRTLRVDSS